MTTDWSQLHGTDVNKAFQEFQNKLNYCLDKIAPIKIYMKNYTMSQDMA